MNAVLDGGFQAVLGESGLLHVFAHGSSIRPPLRAAFGIARGVFGERDDEHAQLGEVAQQGEQGQFHAASSVAEATAGGEYGAHFSDQRILHPKPAANFVNEGFHAPVYTTHVHGRADDQRIGGGDVVGLGFLGGL